MLASALAVGALVARFIAVAGTSLTYDEATYVDVAHHPWRSAYYSDTLFVRHPPLYFLALGLWLPVAGTSEWLLRLPSLLFSSAGILLTVHAVRVRAGERAAALAALLLGGSFLVLVYALQATMYPLAFLLVALGAWSRATRRKRMEGAALSALALTHLFGLVFLATWAWQRRRTVRAWAPWAAPPLAWLGLAVAGVLLTRASPGSELGPIWQALRSAEILADAFHDVQLLLHHAWVFALTLLFLNPLHLVGMWDTRHGWGPWGWAALALTLAFLTGPAFLRFGLVVLPVAMAAGVASFRLHGPGIRRDAVVSVLVAIAALTAGTAYVNAGLDPRAANDVPGLLDWRDAVARVQVVPGNLSIAAPAPPAVAHYLQRHGWSVSDASSGPDLLVLQDDQGRTAELRMASSGDAFGAFGAEGAVLLVPAPWTGVQAHLFRTDHVVCFRAEGLLAMARDAAACPGHRTDPSPL